MIWFCFENVKWEVNESLMQDKILELLVCNCCSHDRIYRIVVVMKILFIGILVNIFLVIVVILEII